MLEPLRDVGETVECCNGETHGLLTQETGRIAAAKYGGSDGTHQKSP